VENPYLPYDYFERLRQHYPPKDWRTQIEGTWIAERPKPLPLLIVDRTYHRFLSFCEECGLQTRGSGRHAIYVEDVMMLFGISTRNISDRLILRSFPYGERGRHIYEVVQRLLREEQRYHELG
jgi:hypothetical protein